MNKSAKAIDLLENDRRVLQSWVRANTTPQQIAHRGMIILRSSEGMANSRIAKETGVSRTTVIEWRKRFLNEGLSALTQIKPGRGRRPRLGVERVEQIVKDTLNSLPPAATHWSCRSMAKAQGVSHATVQRIWDAHGLQPHRVKTFKLCKDKRFEEKLIDVVGLYMDPPDKAIVLCVDEKSQIQALDLTQPGLPIKKGRCGTMTHDYKRNGTAALFAALNILDGKVVGECHSRHRHQEFLKFIRRLDREFPRKTDLHLILDNYGTHSHYKVKAWLEKHPRFKLHFIPTSASWLNLVERWFRDLTDKRIRRGVFRNVPALIDAIMEYITVNNDNPKPFVWTASADAILKKVSKYRVILETVN